MPRRRSSAEISSSSTQVTSSESTETATDSCGCDPEMRTIHVGKVSKPRMTGDRVLAHHQGEGQERGVEHRRPQDRQDDGDQHPRPRGPEVAGRLGEGAQVRAAHAGVEGPVDERQRQDDVDEDQDPGQRRLLEGEERLGQRRVQEVVRRPGQHAAHADDQRDRRQHQRQEGEQLDRRPQPGQPQLDQHDGRHHQQQRDDDGQAGERQRPGERLGEPLGAGDRRVVLERDAAAAAVAHGEQHRRGDRDEEVQAEQQQDGVPPGARPRRRPAPDRRSRRRDAAGAGDARSTSSASRQPPLGAPLHPGVEDHDQADEHDHAQRRAPCRGSPSRRRRCPTARRRSAG